MYSNQIFVLSVILIVVIGMTMWCSCSTYTPYSENTIFSKHSEYEGFEDEKKEEENADEKEEEEKMEGFGDMKKKGEGYEDMKKKVEGFESLHPAPYQKSDLLDKFSQVPGKLDCKGYGYHNSRGPLCLTDDLVTALKTRGGNASGKPDSMGN
jgi:hypothetical protein